MVSCYMQQWQKCYKSVRCLLLLDFFIITQQVIMFLAIWSQCCLYMLFFGCYIDIFPTVYSQWSWKCKFIRSTGSTAWSAYKFAISVSHIFIMKVVCHICLMFKHICLLSFVFPSDRFSPHYSQSHKLQGFHFCVFISHWYVVIFLGTIVFSNHIGLIINVKSSNHP